MKKKLKIAMIILLIIVLAVCAIASSVETAIQGLLSAKQRPLTADTPILIPVKEPGPDATDTISISENFNPQFLSVVSIRHITV